VDYDGVLFDDGDDDDYNGDDDSDDCDFGEVL